MYVLSIFVKTYSTVFYVNNMEWSWYVVGFVVFASHNLQNKEAL